MASRNNDNNNNDNDNDNDSTKVNVDNDSRDDNDDGLDSPHTVEINLNVNNLNPPPKKYKISSLYVDSEAIDKSKWKRTETIPIYKKWEVIRTESRILIQGPFWFIFEEGGANMYPVYDATIRGKEINTSTGTMTQYVSTCITRDGKQLKIEEFQEYNPMHK